MKKLFTHTIAKLKWRYIKSLNGLLLFQLLAVFFIMLFSIQGGQAQAPSCDCTEYIYLNEPAAQSVLKFRVDPGGVALVEVLGANGGPHWYPGANVSELPSPHGFGYDLNGNIYIGEVGANGDIRKFNCDGVIEPEDPSTITNNGTGQNFFSIDNTLYVNTDGGPTAYDLCTGQTIGKACLNNSSGNLWGLSYNPVTQMVYASQRGGTQKVWVFTLAQLEQSIADNGATCINPLIQQGSKSKNQLLVGDTELPNNTGGLFGIVGDNDENFYVVKSTVDGGAATFMLKYDANGGFLDTTASFVSGDVANGAIGIVWSEGTNRLFISNFTDDAATDCISVFDAATMDYIGTGAPNPGLAVDNRGKAIAIVKECCPTNLPDNVDIIVCGETGDKFFLNEEAFGDCDGLVCGSSWDTVGTLPAGMSFDTCDNSVTLTQEGNFCGTFKIILAAVSSTECPADTATFTICSELCPVGAIGNYVWVDENSDGFQDEGEVGIPNVLVVLKDGNGTPIDTTFTDANGQYLFPDLPDGDYFVDIDETSLPNGLTQTTIFTNNVDASDADLITDDGDYGNKSHAGNGYAITLDLGEENLTADFGYNYNPTDDVNDPMGSPPAALGDRVWIDTDGDGAQDPEEVGVSGVEVVLFGDPDKDGVYDTPLDTAITDANGFYLFDDLPPGSYTTQVTDDDGASHDILGADYTQTGDPDMFGLPAQNPDNTQTTPIVLGPGDVFLNSDYGYQPEDTAPVGSIGNTIWFDNDADGNGPADSDPDSDGSNGAGVDAGEIGIAGVTVALIQDNNGNGVYDAGDLIVASDVTDADGLYLFQGLPLDDGGGDGDADYLVWVNDADNVLSGLRNTFDEDGGAGTDATGFGNDADMVGGLSAIAINGGSPDNRDQDFGYTIEVHESTDGYIGNYVWFDQDGDDAGGQTEADGEGDVGIEGVKIELINSMGFVIRTTTTDENGFYFFGNLEVDADGEDYQVRIASDNFLDGGVLDGLASTYEPDADNDNEGDFVSLSTAVPGNLDQDFGYTASGTAGSIGNTIWVDLNADGILNNMEDPIAGVTVDLYRDLDGNGVIDPGEPLIGSMTTNAMGMYLFTGLPIDDGDGDVDYVVDVSDRNGVLNGYWHSLGSQDATSNNGDDPMDNSKNDTYGVSLDATIPDNLNVDFGYYVLPAAVGNYVWIDIDNDGLQDDGETGLNGVQVLLEIAYPDGTIDTLVTVTKNDTAGNPGFYDFGNLLYDEDYNMATPDGGDPATTEQPLFVVSVDPNQAVFTSMNLSPTITNVNGNSNDNEDSDDFAGVTALPVQGNQSTGAVDPETDENVVASYDFGAFPAPLGAIGNYVWVDENSDGFQDEGEVGIPNVRVFLKDDNGNPLDATFTDANGQYLFPDLPDGDYFVDVDETTIPNGLTPTGIFTNVVDGDDADVVRDDGDFGNKQHTENGYAITLDPGEENLTADFGYNYNPPNDVNNNMGTAALGDRVWIDTDGDGAQDPEEVGVSGVEVVLFGDPDKDGVYDTPLDTVITDANGFYLFDNLPPGSYTTQVTDDDGASHDILGADYTQTGDPDMFGLPAQNPDNTQTTPIVLGPGDVFLNSDYGYQPGNNAPVGSIGNTIWFDNDADGNGPADSDPDSDGSNGAGVDAGEIGIAGVTVALIQDNNGNGVYDAGDLIVASDVTDADGLYLFQGLPLDDGGGDGDADYLVWVNDADNVLSGLRNTFDEDGGVGTDATGFGNDADMVGGLSAIAINGGSPDNRDQDFGYTAEGHMPGDGYIGNYVWFDADGNDPNGQTDADADMDAGIEGVVVNLLNNMGIITGTTTTDENGFYFFGNLPVSAGGIDYQVVVAPENFNAGGVLAGLENSYDPDNMVAMPNDTGGLVSLTTAVPGNLDQDFGYTGAGNVVGSIGNTIWEDTNADGILNNMEDPIAGVTVDLYRDLDGNGVIDPGEPLIGSMTTNAMGMYLFTSLPIDDGGGDNDADYVVDVSDRNGVLNGYWHSLSPNQVASTEGGDDAMDNSKGDTYGVSLDAAIPDNLNVDFGYYVLPASVGNYVWVDTDNDGLQDDGETGLNGVEVLLQITYPDGTIDTLVTVTKNDTAGNPGFYDFGNLLYDEDYNMSTPAGGNPASTGQPLFVISVDSLQMILTSMNLAPTMTDVNSDANNKEDSDSFAGVTARPVQGNQSTGAVDPETNEDVVASYDFGIAVELNAIGDTAFIDVNANGIQDAGDVGLDNVKVFLVDVATGSIIDSTFTDANGAYLFDTLAAGKYYVIFDPSTANDANAGLFGATVQNEGINDTIDSDINFAGLSDTVMLMGLRDTNLTLDAGYVLPVAFGDTVFIDENQNGIQDDNDGFVGATVTLFDANTGDTVKVNLYGNPVIPQVTDMDGFYLFDSLPPGEYYVEFDLTTAPNFMLYLFTGPKSGGDDELDSDADTTGTGSPYIGSTIGNPVMLNSGDGTMGLDTAFNIDAGVILIDGGAIKIQMLIAGALGDCKVPNERMSDDLRTNGLVPLVSPYGTGEVITDSAAVLGDQGNPDSNIVDWVLVQLRDKDNPSIVLAERSGLLSSGGMVFDTTGMDFLMFLNPFISSFDSVYVAVNHRNHNGVMTARPIDVDRMFDMNNPDIGVPFCVDFTNTDSTFFNVGGISVGTEQRNVDGRFALWAGDVNGDHQIDFNDDPTSICNQVTGDANNPKGTRNFIVKKYQTGDVTLDGQVRCVGENNDVDAVLNSIYNHPDNAANCDPGFIIPEQLPKP